MIAKIAGALAAVLLVAAPASALTILVEKPTNWRLQNYIGNRIETYYVTDVPCGSGALTFPATATVEDKQAYWALVMTAKTTGRTVGVVYEVSGGVCTIQSFFMDG